VSGSQVSDCHRVSVPIRLGVETLTISGWSTAPSPLAPDVIWLHANGFNALTYRNTLAPLAGRMKILAVDERGHGGTPQAAAIEGKRDQLDLRDDLLALLEAVAPDRRVILAGHSMGGCVSLLAAAEAPARVRALALFDPVVLTREAAVAVMRRDGSAVSESSLIAKARSRRRAFASREEVFAQYRGRTIFRTWPEAALRDYIEAGFRDTAEGGVELACAPEWEAASDAGLSGVRPVARTRSRPAGC
jgi:pimeloyl-ACP methyl ester carboxylesterase